MNNYNVRVGDKLKYKRYPGFYFQVIDIHPYTYRKIPDIRCTLIEYTDSGILTRKNLVARQVLRGIKYQRIQVITNGFSELCNKNKLLDKFDTICNNKIKGDENANNN